MGQPWRSTPSAELMKTKDVRIDTELNEHVWSQGVRNVPFRVRVTLTRKRGEEDEDKKASLYTLVELQRVASYKGLQTEKVAASE